MARHWAVGPELRDWIAALPDQLADLAYRWRIEIGAPFEPGGFASWVAPATTEDGTRCVLKAAFPYPGAWNEAAALDAWKERGAVRVLRSEPFTMLLEHCEPGTSLSAVALEEADAISADLIKRLWIAPPSATDWGRITSYAGRAAGDIREWSRRDDVPFARSIVDDAIAFAEDASGRDGPSVLLHADFHHNNVLASGDRWLVIDAKGYVGEPAFDAAFLLVDRVEDVIAHLDPSACLSRRVDLFTDALELDRDRLLGWALVRCVHLVLNSLADSFPFGIKRVPLVPLLAALADR